MMVVIDVYDHSRIDVKGLTFQASFCQKLNSLTEPDMTSKTVMLF